jgi:hypothetical protein
VSFASNVRPRLRLLLLIGVVVGIAVALFISRAGTIPTLAQVGSGASGMTVYRVTNPNAVPLDVEHVISDNNGFRYSFWAQVPAGQAADYHLRDMPQVPSPFQGAVNLSANLPFTAQIIGTDPAATPGTATPSPSPTPVLTATATAVLPTATASPTATATRPPATATATRPPAVTPTATVVAAGPSGLVAAYGFEEGSGTTAGDGSGHGYTGAISGATWVSQGRFGKALAFNGQNSWVTVDAAALTLPGPLTVEAWVNPTANGGWRSIVVKEQADQLAYGLYSDSDTGRPRGLVYIGGEQDAAGTAQLPLNTWTHLAMTYDGAQLRLFVNGAPAGSRALTGAIAGSTQPLRIGGNGIWGEYFAGLIDEVRIYSRALSQAEIQADMNLPVTVAAATPTATPPPAATATRTPTPVPTATPTARPSATPTPTATTAPNPTATPAAETKLAVAAVTTSPKSAPGRYLIDGKLWTRWETNWTYPDTAWFSLDLGGVRQVNRLRWHLADGRYAPSVKIEVSTDGNQWVTVAEDLAAGAVVNSWQEQTIDRSARYVRWTVANRAGAKLGKLGSVSEVQVYGN